MNEALENNSAATPGAKLKQAREQAGLSIERVAKDLYLDVQVIHSIEVNRFKDLGAPVYAKGYLRKYARLVGLTEEDVLQRYQLLDDAPGVADPIPAAMGTVQESRKPLPRWILWVVIGLIVLAAAVTLLSLRPVGNPVTDTNSQGNLVSRPLSAPGTATESAAAVGALTLRFEFSGDSWVDVHDAHNQQVLYEMGTANSSREVTAIPPLQVVLGAAAVVKLQVNSRGVAVPATQVQAGVARFIVNAKGMIE